MPQPAAAPPATDIYLLSLSGGLASMKGAKPAPVSAAAGYDNQPNVQSRWRQDPVRRELETANRSTSTCSSAPAGAVTQLTQTPENENSPTYLPEGMGEPGGFSVVRTEPDKAQRLWRFDAQGRNPQLVLADVKPVGYHAWVKAGSLALFVLGPPATLQIASVSTGKAEIAAEDIGRSLHRIPGTPHVSFVQRDAAASSGSSSSIVSKQIEPLVKAVEGSADGEMTWMPDGKTILMSAGPKVFSWTRGGAGWTKCSTPRSIRSALYRESRSRRRRTPWRLSSRRWGDRREMWCAGRVGTPIRRRAMAVSRMSLFAAAWGAFGRMSPHYVTTQE